MKTEITEWIGTEWYRRRGPLELEINEREGKWVWYVLFIDEDDDRTILENGECATCEEAKKRADEWVLEFTHAIWRPREG